VAAHEKTAVLVIRAWLDKSSEELALRARITQTLDVSAPTPEKIESAAASEQEIVAAVREWLRSFRGR
jgi:hypothetical protein